MKQDKSPIPQSGGQVLDRAGVDNEGYIDKSNPPVGERAILNYLPPGQDISDQCNAEIYNMEMKHPMASGMYAGDGWTGEVGKQGKPAVKEWKTIDLPLAGSETGKKGY